MTVDLDGRRNEGIGGIIDETEQVQARLRAEEALRRIAEHSALSDTVLSAMPDSVAVLDSAGTIVAVNEAWLRFARENGAESDPGVGVGANYLEVCQRSAKDDPFAESVLEGLQSVLRGAENTFQTAYPCHSPTHERWFSMTVASGAREGYAVVFHSRLQDLIDSRQELEQQIAAVQELSQRLVAESEYLRVEIEALHDTEEVVGSSEAMKRVLDQAELVATTGATVLLLGETGVGKELLARRIHAGSARHERPLIKVDCGTLPAGLVESELFGHEKGAFTGAHKAKPGRFELANHGTIFLDEIGELPMEAQTKLLRVLEDGQMQRVGSLSEKKVDVRIIAATNRDLRQAMRDGRFREDLFYRLSVFPVEVPALRERPEDIPYLVELFVRRYSKLIGRRVDRIPRSCMNTLVAYDWPGNVRELRNVVERSVILCQDGTLKVDALVSSSAGIPVLETSGNLERDLEAVERARITRALEAARWKIKGEGNAASQLGLSPSGVRSKMKRLGITRPE
jgi:transcriptional regulator with GAF, ATPase, and Fis domain